MFSVGFLLNHHVCCYQSGDPTLHTTVQKRRNGEVSHLPVNGKVQPHEFCEFHVLVAQHSCEVGGPVLLGVDGAYAGSISVQVAVDNGRNGRQFGNKVHGVFVYVLPVKSLVHTIRIRLGEFGFRVTGSDGSAELGHGVKVAGEVVEHGYDMGWQICTVGPFLEHIKLC